MENTATMKRTFCNKSAPGTFPDRNCKGNINEQMKPQIFTTFLISALSFVRGDDGWSFNLTPSSADVKKLIKSLSADSEWTVAIEV